MAYYQDDMPFQFETLIMLQLYRFSLFLQRFSKPQTK